MNDLSWDFPYTSQRMPVLADNVVCTSQPLASAAGLDILRKGGNAVDAAVAAAIALTVVEPCMNGIGGDSFALVWDGQRMHGLNASGRSPRRWTREHFSRYSAMPPRGWDSVTVPGAVSGWRELSQRFGKLPFAQLFEAAIRHARDGWIVSPIVSRQWQGQVEDIKHMPGFAEAFAPRGRAPLPGERFTCPGQADTLEAIARSGGEEFYRGSLARAIAEHARATGGLMDEEDLAEHRADWVEPISTAYRGIELHEIGPNGQGISALIALGILDSLELPRPQLDSTAFFHYQIEAMKLAFADVQQYVADPASMTITAQQLLDRGYLRRRAKLLNPDAASFPGAGKPHTGGTTYLATADAGGMMVSLIQSNFKGFGSGVVIPGTGIAMHNRGWGFNMIPGHANEVAPRKRPFHTIIPGFLMEGGKPLMSFGVMGGSLQAQGHVQVTVRIGDHRQNPQAVIDAPRWRILEDNVRVMVEWNFPPEAVAGLRRLGHDVQVAPRFSDEFGGSQAIMRMAEGYLGASDHRKDGQAVGY
ncbi:MAG: gamma-glutamyltranspeptidase precursor (Gamma-glutamyltransferase)-like protein [Ramlibacter sp.]|nr:gamma-glutamyltranspeptidase precursor (Gamma-glutamyltransferase)-like protein [Ramlibacter sp.]